MVGILNPSVMNDIDNVFLRLCWSDSKVSRYDRHKTQAELMGRLRVYSTIGEITCEQAMYIANASEAVRKELEKGMYYGF